MSSASGGYVRQGGVLVPEAYARDQRRRADAEPFHLRRWEAAKTDRLNRAHWEKATGSTINVDLAADLETLRVRSAHEASTNPTVEGVVSTYVNDLVGEDGPRLQIVFEGKRRAYEQQLEEAWGEFWTMPDVNGELAGPDLVRLWARQFWTCGEYLTQITKDGTGSRARTVLHNLHPRRLQTPMKHAGDAEVTLGIRRTRTGRPVEYFVMDEDERGVLRDPEKGLSAADVLHDFIVTEPGQARGVPWLASSLQTTADVRDFDAQVLDAARAAADFAVVLSHEDEAGTHLNINESVEIERRRMTTLPPGWKATQLQTTQPAPNYIQYRAERHRDIGRAVNMPLMMVRLDSSGHNYSSARFDGQIYQRSLQAVRAWVERRALRRLVELVEREGRLAGRITAPRPKGLKLTWTWPILPHVDRLKEANAERVELESNTLAWSDAVIAKGGDPDETFTKVQRDTQRFKEAGLPVPWEPKAAPPAGVKPDDEDKDDDETQERPTGNAGGGSDER